MLGAEIQIYREQRKLTQRQFVKAIKPFLQTYPLDEQMLSRIETGKVANADRINDIVEAIHKAFPDVLPEVKAKKTSVWQNKRTLKLVGIALALVLILVTTVFFVIFQDHPWIKNVMYGIGVFTALGTAVGLFSAIVLKGK